MNVGKRIESIMEKKDIKQNQLAEKVGINKSVLNRIINGSRPCKDFELAKIADVLDVSTDYLLGRLNYAAKDGYSNREKTKDELENFEERFKKFLEWEKEVDNRKND
ncbi:helix-turn-helix domain-containing protein [Bacillus solitudinis]|uniref:helix-turn-helix domain-containing protein n=1 Tax=Bacillus solitudinis TaxID=2014074 RepID=UPI000C241C13|nr:helix-turn-helix transcriptional regulator [Bacillus solitudinis]